MWEAHVTWLCSWKNTVVWENKHVLLQFIVSFRVSLFRENAKNNIGKQPKNSSSLSPRHVVRLIIVLSTWHPHPHNNPPVFLSIATRSKESSLKWLSKWAPLYTRSVSDRWQEHVCHCLSCTCNVQVWAPHPTPGKWGPQLWDQIAAPVRNCLEPSRGSIQCHAPGLNSEAPRSVSTKL